MTKVRFGKLKKRLLDFVNASWNVDGLRAEVFLGQVELLVFRISSGSSSLLERAPGLGRRGVVELCTPVCGKVVSVLRGSTPTPMSHSRWCEPLRLDEINLSHAWSFSSQPWGFRSLFEGATGEKVSTGSA